MHTPHISRRACSPPSTLHQYFSIQQSAPLVDASFRADVARVATTTKPLHDVRCNVPSRQSVTEIINEHNTQATPIILYNTICHDGLVLARIHDAGYCNKLHAHITGCASCNTGKQPAAAETVIASAAAAAAVHTTGPVPVLYLLVL
jgi:hypothetical protein